MSRPMEAELVFADKVIFEDGAIQEIVVWRLPAPATGSAHGFKYRLFYGVSGRRVIGYDNERGKGDHRHRGDVETPYTFVGWERLIDDFLAEVAQVRSKA